MPTKIIVATTLALVSGVAHAQPLDVIKHREVLLDPNAAFSSPQADPQPFDQTWARSLDIDKATPPEIPAMIQLAQARIALAQQANQPPPQWALDTIQAGDDLARQSFAADMLVEMH